MINKTRSAYLVELYNAIVDEEGIFTGVDIQAYCFCQTEDEAREACEILTRDLPQSCTYTVKGENFKYPFYNYQKIPYFN
ncbi:MULTISPECIES: hypothetical protein [unclassified Priestia]|uniref:hypothetical protein n=1 Tax=unclassified Priestia TaxID=2800374 RepID=UPI003672B8EE